MNKEKIKSLKNLAEHIKTACKVGGWKDLMTARYLTGVKISLLAIYKVLSAEMNLPEQIIPSYSFDKEEIEEDMMSDSYYNFSSNMSDMFEFILDTTGWIRRTVPFSTCLRQFYMDKGLCEEWDECIDIPEELKDDSFQEFIQWLEDIEDYPFRLKGLEHIIKQYYEYDCANNLRVDSWIFFENEDIGRIVENLDQLPAIRQHPLVVEFTKELKEISNFACVSFPMENEVKGGSYVASFISGYLPDTGEVVSELGISPAVFLHFVIMQELISDMKQELPILFLKGGSYEKAV